MNWTRVRAVARKDGWEVLRNRQALLPVLLVPTLLGVVMPAAVLLLAGSPLLATSVNGLDSFLEQVPQTVAGEGLSTEQAVFHAVAVYFFAPLFLLIPVVVASVVASSSFAGEKERHTLEGLLCTPVTARELVAAKIGVSVIVAVLVAWAAFLAYTVLVLVIGGRVMEGWFFPTFSWAVLVLLLVPLVSVLSVSLVVMVSQRSSTMQGAQGIAGLLVLPVVGVVVSQSSGLMVFGTGPMLVTAGVLLLADLLVFALAVRSVDREKLVTGL